MTKDNATSVVRLSVRDWFGILGVLFTIIVTIFGAGLTIESRLTEVLTRQQQLEVRIERIEDQIDRGDARWRTNTSP